ncbi:MAG: ROK family protein, partial [Vicinamibacteraceae bacterium]
DICYEGIGVSLPGRIDLASQRLVFAPNLAWNGVDLKGPLEEATNLPVALENAANACALAELWFGEHIESVRNLIAVTVSEGIGGGVILNGQLVQGSTGVAGEFGHMTLIEEGLPCRCGNHGCWEMYASNSAATRYYAEATSRNRRRDSMATAERQIPTFEDIVRLADQGDARALAAIDRQAHYIGAGAALLVTGLAPDVIVIVGEVTRFWSRIGPAIERMVEQRSFTQATTRILPTDAASQPRLRGTIALVLQKHFGAPALM